MRLAIFTAFLCTVIGLSAATLPVSMSTSNGVARGTTTIGGRLLATNTVANGGTNYIAGSLHLGNSNFNHIANETLTLKSVVTNPPSSVYETRSYLSIGFTTNSPSLIHGGIASVVQVSTNNTADWGNASYPGLMAFNATVQPETGSSGTIRRVAGVATTVAGAVGSGAIFDESVGVWVDTANTLGDYFVGVKVQGLSAAVNNTALWLGIPQNTYPSVGNWGIDDTTGYISRFSSNVVVLGTNIGNGYMLTNLVAENIESGTLSDARLSANVALLNRPVQVFTGGTNSFSRVAIGSSGATNWLDVSSGNLTTNSKAVNVTGTLAASASFEVGVSLSITGSGSGANQNRAVDVVLNSGYTGSAATFGLASANNSAGTGASAWTAGPANYGLFGNNGLASTGHKVGVFGTASSSSTMNAGIMGRAATSSGSPLLNLGGAGIALSATYNVGGFFGLMSTAPTIVNSAALMADNGAVAAPIFVARDNGTEVFSIADGGQINGNAAGVSNAVTIISGSNVTITTNSDNRTFTISSSGGAGDGGILGIGAGANITITTNSATSLTIASSGGSSGDSFWWTNAGAASSISNNFNIRAGAYYGNALGVSNAIDLVAGNCITITTNDNGRTFTIAAGSSGVDFLTNNRAAATLSGLTLTGPTTNTAQSVPNWYGGLWGTNPATGAQWLLTNGNVIASGTFTGNGSGLSNVSSGTFTGTTWGGISNVAVTATNIIVNQNRTVIQDGSANTLTVSNGNVCLSGNLGVGTITPSQLVNVFATANSTVGVDVFNTSSGNNAASRVLLGHNTGATAGTYGGFYWFNTSYSAVGMFKPNSFVIDTAGVNGIALVSESTGPITFTTGSYLSANQRMIIDSAGNVGIGTASPSRMLSVNGTSYFSNTVSVLNNVSTTAINIGGVLKTDTTAVGNVGAGADTLITYTIPASQLGANGESFEFDCWGYCTNNANTKQITVLYGATTLLDTTSLVLNGVSWRAHGRIVRTGAATQTATCEFTVGGTLLSAVNSTICLTTAPAETLSGTVVFKCTGTSTISPNDNDIVQNGMSLKWFPSGN